jgi:hypothetical protein
MLGDEVWLVAERRSTGEQKYYVSNLPADTSLKTLATTIKARWICEQAHQQLKEELGLDQFEGRSWTGLHRPALMTMIAYAFPPIPPSQGSGTKKEGRRRQVEQFGTCGFDGGADTSTFMAAEIVHDDDVAGTEFRHRDLLDIGLESSPLIGPSSTIGATMPLLRRPATKVVVFQWPCGIAARRRWPRGARP